MASSKNSRLCLNIQHLIKIQCTYLNLYWIKKKKYQPHNISWDYKRTICSLFQASEFLILVFLLFLVYVVRTRSPSISIFPNIAFVFMWKSQFSSSTYSWISLNCFHFWSIFLEMIWWEEHWARSQGSSLCHLIS